MDLFGTVWSHMVLYGPICSHMLLGIQSALFLGAQSQMIPHCLAWSRMVPHSPKMVFNQFYLFDSFPVSNETFPAGGGGGGWVGESNRNKEHLSLSLS